MTEPKEKNLIPYLLTALGSIVGSVLVLWFYGYLHFAKPEDSLLLNDFTMLKTVEGEDYRISLEPAEQVGQCIQGIVVLADPKYRLTGVLVDSKKRAVHCPSEDKPERIEQ